jgi:hypothetical protein
MQRHKENYPELTDDEFNDLPHICAVEGICDRCEKIGVKCYHILKLGLHKLNGDECLARFKNSLNFYWRKDVKKLLASTPEEILQKSTSGHFCMECADVMVEGEMEYFTDEFGHWIKDEKITFCLTKIYDDILVLHVE